MNINDQSTGDDFKKLAEIEKELGNKELKEKNYDKAIEKYTNSLTFLPSFVTAYCNRSAAYYYKEDYLNGIKDANKALSYDENCTKAYYRRYQGKKHLQLFEEARLDLLKILDIEPNNEQVRNELIDFEAIIKIKEMDRIYDEDEEKNKKEIDPDKNSQKIINENLEINEKLDFKDISLKINELIELENIENNYIESELKSYNIINSKSEKSFLDYENMITNLNSAYSYIILDKKFSNYLENINIEKISTYINFCQFLITKNYNNEIILKAFDLLFNLFQSKEFMDDKEQAYNILALQLRASFYSTLMENNNALNDYKKILNINPENNLAKEKIQELSQNNTILTNNPISISKQKQFNFEFIENLNEEGKKNLQLDDKKKALESFTKAVSLLEFYHMDQLDSKKEKFVELYFKLLGNKAQTHLIVDEYEKSLEICQKMFQFKQSNIKALTIRGLTYQKIAEMKEKNNEDKNSVIKTYEKSMLDFKNAVDLEKDERKKIEIRNEFQKIVANVVRLKRKNIENNPLKEEFEKKCRGLVKNTDKLFEELKNCNFNRIYENNTNMNEGTFVNIINTLITEGYKDLDFSIKFLELLSKQDNLSNNVRFLSNMEKSDLLKIFEESEKQSIISQLKKKEFEINYQLIKK